MLLGRQQRAHLIELVAALLELNVLGMQKRKGLLSVAERALRLCEIHVAGIRLLRGRLMPSAPHADAKRDEREGDDRDDSLAICHGRGGQSASVSEQRISAVSVDVGAAEIVME